MSHLENESVKRVRAALADAGHADTVRALDATARSARDAAAALDCPLGAIVKSLVFRVGGSPVLALVAGDRICKADALGRVLNIDGAARRCDADAVRAATGFAIGGVAPVGLAGALPCAIDVSLKRFDRLWAAAGHPHCVFSTDVPDLKRLTGGIVSYAIAEAG